MQRNIETIRETFSLLDDWEARYRYLIELGNDLGPFPDALRTEDHRVHGCTSRVWMVMEKDQDGHCRFQADSDAHIVRGLIAVVLACVQGRRADAIPEIDIMSIFKSLGLEEHLSPNRRNGFYAMVERIRTLAKTSS